MKRQGNRLTPVAVRAANTPGLYGDGHGLYLQVSAFNTKAWVFRYMIDGRARKMGLGALHTVTLAEARAEAAEARKKVRKGIDPIEVQEAEKAERRLKAISNQNVQRVRGRLHQGERGDLETQSTRPNGSPHSTKRAAASSSFRQSQKQSTACLSPR